MSLSTTPATYYRTGKSLAVEPSSTSTSPIKKEDKSKLSNKQKNIVPAYQEIRSLFPNQVEIEPSNEHTEFAVLSELIQTNLNLNTQLEFKINSLEESIALLEEEKKELLKQITPRQEKNTNLAGEINSLTQRITERDSQIKALNLEKKEFQRNIEALQRENKELVSQIKDQETQLKLANDKISRYELNNRHPQVTDKELIKLNESLHKETTHLQTQLHFSTPFTKSMSFLGTLLNLHNGVMFTSMSQGISPEKFVPMFGAFATIANINFAFHRLKEFNELEAHVVTNHKSYLTKDVKVLKFIDSVALAGVNTAVFALPLLPESFPAKNYQIFSCVLGWSIIKHLWVASSALSRGDKVDVFQNLAEGVFCGGAFVALAFWNHGGILGPTPKEENYTAALAAGIASFVVVGTILGRTFIPSHSKTSSIPIRKNNFAYSVQLNGGELGATEEKTNETEAGHYRIMDESGDMV